VTRYDDAGNLDPTLDADGRAVLDPGPLQGTIANGIALGPDGRITLGGQSATQLESFIDLGRLLPDGTPDAGFGGGDGVVTTDMDERLFGRGLALDFAGRLVLAGEIGEPLLPDALVGRYTPDGALDGEFGTAGLVRERFSSEAARGGAVAVDAQGRYVIAGTAIGPGGASSIALMRLLASYPVPAVSRKGRVACRGRAATIVGTPKRNRLRGTKRRDVIAALGGNDVVRGLGGNDLICAGAGRDLVKAGRGGDVVAAGAGRDRVFGQAGRDKLLGQQGRDLLVGGPGRDVLRGGPGRDRQRR
jgi:uncharacterized delta-60 repeat protein